MLESTRQTMVDSFCDRLVHSPLPEMDGCRTPLWSGWMILLPGLLVMPGAPAAEPPDEIERAVVLRRLVEDRAPSGKAAGRAPISLPPARIEAARQDDPMRLGNPKRVEDLRRELEASRRYETGSKQAAAQQDAAEARKIREFQDRAWRGTLESQAAEKHRPDPLPGAAAWRQQLLDRARDARDLSIRIERQAQEYRLDSGNLTNPTGVRR